MMVMAIDGDGGGVANGDGIGGEIKIVRVMMITFNYLSLLS